jgi:hypothetical protein
VAPDIYLAKPAPAPLVFAPPRSTVLVNLSSVSKVFALSVTSLLYAFTSLFSSYFYFAVAFADSFCSLVSLLSLSILLISF